MAELDPILYTVAWIAPLEIEAQAALFMLDNRHQGRFPLSRGDDYVFQAGDVCGHNVIIATLPAGQPYGTGSAAALASQVKKFFPNLWFGLLVGVAAGLPNLSRYPPLDIRLGDVLVGLPSGDSAGLIAYDLGKETGHDGFQLLHTGHVLHNTETIVRSAFGSIKLKAPNDADVFLPYYEHVKHKNHTHGTFADPGQDQDHLYLLDDNGVERLVERERRLDSERTRVWYGPIGSGEKLMKNARKRDELRDKHNLIGLEMEAAGTINQVAVGVIRGVCDYGDEHKNKDWQPYAAAMAAAYAKAVLCEIKPKILTQPASKRHVFTDEDNRCLAELLLTNPDDDRRRIEETKGGLLSDSFCWVLGNSEFQQWRDSPHSRLLWIKGDAGKGKTMLMIGIIKELLQHAQAESSQSFSYFMCQGTDSRLNNATAVLRGLIYMLISQQPPLISHLRKKYDHEGRKLFEDANAFYSLSTVFEQTIQDSEAGTIYLIVDGLDECEVDLPELLKLITKTTSMPSVVVKWIVSSRNRGDIEQILGFSHEDSKLSLELNADHVSHAVEAYIDYKISRLILLQHKQVPQEKVRNQLRQKSDGTFLWVALVVQDLQRCRLLGDVSQVLEKTPKGLTPLYNRMLRQIKQLQDQHRDLCLLVLSIITLAYRPLHMLEMYHLSGMHEKVSDVEDLERAVGMCGSLLTIRDGFIYFVHQSAKDHLSGHSSDVIFPMGRSKIHYNIFSQSLQALSTTLRRNIYDLQNADIIVSDIAAVRPDPDPLTSLRYSCVFWLDHILEVDPSISDNTKLTDNGVILTFFTRHFLYWLESLSLIGEVSHGILMLRKLLHREQTRSNLQLASSLTDTKRISLAAVLRRAQPDSTFRCQTILKDAERFANSYGSIIQETPLQTYSAALVFCPQDSETKRLYWGEKMKFIKYVSGIRESWDPCMQILESHGGAAAVTFSPNGQMLASASRDGTVRLWDAATGTTKRTLKGHGNSVTAVAFSPNGQILASASSDGTVQLWDAATGTAKQTLKGHRGSVTAVTFSPNGQMLASASHDHTVRLWDAAAGTNKDIFSVDVAVKTLYFSADDRYLITDRGILCLISTSSKALDNEQAGSVIFVSNKWITRDGQGLIRLPLDYRPTCVAVSDNKVVLGHSTGDVTFLELTSAS